MTNFQPKAPVSRIVFTLLTLSMLTIPGRSQNVTASITGTVADSTGAVVPGAKVTALNK